jgi:hypothetical protein
MLPYFTKLNKSCVICPYKLTDFCKVKSEVTAAGLEGTTSASSLSDSLFSSPRFFLMNSSLYFLERTGTPVVPLVSMMILEGSSASIMLIYWLAYSFVVYGAAIV